MTPGLRNVVDETRRPSLARDVTDATAWSDAQPSSCGSSGRDTRVAEIGPVGSLDPECCSEPQAQPSSDERKRKTGVALAYASARIFGRSAEYTSSSDIRRPKTLSLKRNMSAIEW